jgi:hypothetical protein
MADRPFDPSEAVTFDLAFGHIHLDGAPHRVMIPAQALVKLCHAAGEDETAELAHGMGAAMGHRIALRLAPEGGSDGDEGRARRQTAVRAAGLERVVAELAGEMAITGMGCVSAERWGKALVLVVERSPFGPEGDDLVATVLQAAMQTMTASPARVIRLVRESDRVRFIVVSGATVDAVRMRLDRGESWGSVLAALHGRVAS